MKSGLIASFKAFLAAKNISTGAFIGIAAASAAAAAGVITAGVMLLSSPGECIHEDRDGNSLCDICGGEYISEPEEDTEERDDSSDTIPDDTGDSTGGGTGSSDGNTPDDTDSSGGNTDDSGESSLPTVPASVGLDLRLSASGDYYTVVGTGSCTDTDIVIPDSHNGIPVTAIKVNAFRGNQRITSLTTGSNINIIMSYSFYDCDNLKKITLAKNVDMIYQRAFADCASLDTIIVDTANPFYTSEDNVLYTKPGAEPTDTELRGRMIVLYPGGLPASSFTIPEGTVGIASYAFIGCKNLKSIDIADSVTYIGMEAFSSCSVLDTITVGDNIKHIGREAFRATPYLGSVSNTENYITYLGKYMLNARNCKEPMVYRVREGTLLIADEAFMDVGTVSDITLPESLKYIGNYALSGCESITSLTIPDGVMEIGSHAFSSCPSLTEVIIGNSVEILSEGLFSYCDNLSEISLGSSVKKIGEQCFSGCDGIRHIVLPDTIEYIDDKAFSYCQNLVSITFGKGLKFIGISVLPDNYKLFEICNNSDMDMTRLMMKPWYSDEITHYMDMSNIIISKGESRLRESEGFLIYSHSSENVLLDYFGESSSVVIPESITRIAPKAFMYNEYITSVSFTNSEIKIGEDAFSYCSALTNIECDGNLDMDGNPFFQSGYYLDDNNWEDGLFYIGSILYDAKEDVSSFTVRPGTTDIYNHAFAGCSAESITIPSSVKKIGDYAFSDCTSLTSITIPRSVKEIGSRAFSDCRNLTAVTFMGGGISIGESAFENTSSLARVNIPGVSEWVQNSFENSGANPVGRRTSVYTENKKLAKIEIPSGTTHINAYAFSNFDCQEIHIPKSIRSFGAHAFSGSVNPLGNVYYKGTLSEWLNIEFADKLASPFAGGAYFYPDGKSKFVKELVIPSDIAKINDYAFLQCLGIKKITFESGSICGSIGKYAFYNNASLQGIVLAPSVKTIEESAFESCSALTAVNFDGGINSIGERAFNNCTGLAAVMMGTNITFVGETAFSGCTALEGILYLGGKDSWNTLAKNCLNNELLITPVLYYSEEKPSETGRHWHYVDGNVTMWGEVNPDEAPHYLCHQAETYEEWFSDKFITNAFSYSKELYYSLRESKLYMASVNAWELSHIMLEPSHHIESGWIARRDIYKMIIYDMLGGSGTPEEMAKLYDSVKTQSDTYVYEALKHLGLSSIAQAGDLKTSNYSSELAGAFGNINKLFDILEHFDCLADAINACAQYQAFSQMDEAFKNVLSVIAEEEANPKDLREAAKESIECYSHGVNSMLECILNGVLVNEFNNAMYKIMDEAWQKMIFSIGGPQAVVLFYGAKGVRALGNALFKLDAKNQAYYQLHMTVLMEEALIRALPKLYNIYTTTFDKNEAASYMRCIEMYEYVLLMGADSCIEMLKLVKSSFLLSKDNEEACTQLIESIDSYKSVKTKEFVDFEIFSKKLYNMTYNIEA